MACVHCFTMRALAHPAPYSTAHKTRCIQGVTRLPACARRRRGREVAEGAEAAVTSPTSPRIVHHALEGFATRARAATAAVRQILDQGLRSDDLECRVWCSGVGGRAFSDMSLHSERLPGHRRTANQRLRLPVHHSPLRRSPLLLLLLPLSPLSRI